MCRHCEEIPREGPRASLQRRGSGVRAASCKQLNEPGQDQVGRWARPEEGLLGQGPGEERAQLASELSSWWWTKQPRGWCGTGLPAPTTHTSSLPFPPWSWKDLPSPPDPAKHGLPFLCQAKCPCAFRPQLRCHLPQEDSPDQTSPAGLTPSECPEHSALALVTPRPWSLQWFGGSAVPLPPPPLFLLLVGGPGTWSVLSSRMLDAGMKAASG